MTSSGRQAKLVAAALRLLGVDRLLLVIHDVSFPSAPGEDTGRGTPYGQGGGELIELAAALGFTGLQLGPQGEMAVDNPSPYDSASFSRNTASIALAPLATDPRWGALLVPEEIAGVVSAAAGPATVARHRVAAEGARRLLTSMHDRLRAALASPAPRREVVDLSRRLAAFRERSSAWLIPDALYEILGEQVWTPPFRRLWDPPPGEQARALARQRDLIARHQRAIDAYALRQLVAHEQHEQLRERLRALGLSLCADMQVGLSARDAWAWRRALLEGYRLGAPPSRTNPAGQPWGYGVLHPAEWESGAARELVVARTTKLLSEYDAVRVDHPHGFVCPWVYREDDPDPSRAVRSGARLRSSPALPDHPELARYSIARPDQLDAARPRYDDGWVRELSEAQIDRYAALIDAMIGCAREAGRGADALVCEVLSTQPYPLACVMARHGLGRFRVTHKARLSDPNDPYRSDRAGPADWIMVTTHDTPPLWLLLERWHAQGELEARARQLAARLAPSEAERGRLAEQLAADPTELAQAMFAELFASPARNVMVFVSDLFGLTEVYNRPGTVREDNWVMRLPPSFRDDYEAAVGEGRALDLRRALALALMARGGEEAWGLAARLAELPPCPRP